MSSSSRIAVLLRVVLLPLGLIGATVAGLGSYFEANDDMALAWLFSGVIAAKPVASVPLYFHGYGHLLAAAYAALPALPWFGLLLGLGLSVATVLVFAVLDHVLRARWRGVAGVGALVLFFGLAWLEHWLWFSYVRVGLLLAGAGVLFAAQRPGRRGTLAVGLAVLLAAWLMRPSLAVMGFGAALPAAWWLAGSWRRAAPVLLGGASILALATAVAAFLQTPEQAHTQARDRYFARILDFDQLQPRPRYTADSLGTSAVSLWLMGDSTLVNEALCQRAYRFDARSFYGREVPAKLRLRAGLLVRDYFPVLLVLAATALAVWRQRKRPVAVDFWLVQAAYVGALVFLAGVLKLPPRLELPLLDFWLLANLVYVLRPAAAGSRGMPGPVAAERTFPLWQLRGAALLACGAVALYGVKTWHRHQVLSAERRRHEAALSVLRHRGAGAVRIVAGPNDFLKSLSPFRAYSVGPGPVLLLSGWPSHDASQARLRRALSGTADQTECLRRLARLPTYSAPPRALWVLTPETARWLARRFRFDGAPMLLYPEGSPLANDTALAARVYHIQPWPEH
ncbi:hypothetical protein [Hymenobacter armeniacus]|uniref:Glycosyltransferase RgtA/B/C/D-like domain-containing protein n=1 Tax=Hymenobacter armeniacus TaxID=2771358 RepID=A0ABR8JQR7_9BACT|nr:hypothetical protein [Hymenobacter armeniacus]MBD2721113.1 hypothetical protein [Hymenobacter armeniacus]